MVWKMEEFIMASSRNRVEVPDAKEAMNRFKMEVASELGVPLSNGYNGNLPLIRTAVLAE